MPALDPSTAATELGSLLVVVAHPDDETYLAGGVLAAARDAGHQATVVTATYGEMGFGGAADWPSDRAAAVRRWESAAAMATLGVHDHRWLELPDGGCADVPDHLMVEHLVAVVDEVRPDTVLTFGPDGVTAHPDHVAVGAWTLEAARRSTTAPRVLFAAVEQQFAARFADLHERFEVYMEPGYPMTVPAAELALHVRVDGPDLDRKLVALRAMATQTAELVATIGEQRYREWVCDEFFVEPPHA